MITRITDGRIISEGNFEITKGLLIKDGVTAYDRTWWTPINMGKSFVMLDLETLGVGHTPVIVQISAVEFDLITGLVLSEFTCNVCKDSALAAGLIADEGTIQFWNNQPQEVRDRVFTNGIPLKSALQKLQVYLNSLGSPYIWGNGIRADNVWILSAYRALKLPDPFSYNKDLDFRTIYALADMKADLKNDPKPWKGIEFIGLPHNSLDDCKHQIKKAHLMWKYLFT